MRYESISQEIDDVLFAVGSGPYKSSMYDEHKEACLRAVNACTEKDLIRILTHDDPSNIDQWLGGALMERGKSLSASPGQILHELSSIYGNNWGDDGLLSSVGNALHFCPKLVDAINATEGGWEEVRETMGKIGDLIRRRKE